MLVSSITSSLVLGSRVILYPQKILEEFILPIHLSAGLSYHLIREKYIGGDELSSGHYSRHNYNVPAALLGIGVNTNLSKSVRLRLNADLFVQINKVNAFPNEKGSGALKFAVDYFF